jgi:dephospho-CoA kinase
MKLIGLTGNIATGKSEVAKTLRELGATVIDADAVARDIVAVGQPALAQIAQTFGEDILLPDGSLNRKKLGDIVFNDKVKLKQLEDITSPAARAEIWARIALAFKHAKDLDHVVVIEVIRLFEAGYDKYCDQVWVTHCPPEIQIERLMYQRKFSENEAKARVSAQPPQADKVARATMVIDTSGTIEHTKTQVIRAFRAIFDA